MKELIGVAASMVALVYGENFALDSTAGLKVTQVKAEAVTYKGRKALRVTDTAPVTANDAGRLALIRGVDAGRRNRSRPDE